MDSLRNIISDIRIFLYGGILTLPLTIAGTLLILGLFTANYAILFFLVGFLILTPFVATILNFAIGALFTGKTFNPFLAKTSDVCKLVIPYATRNSGEGIGQETVAVSSWVAMVSFFIGYIFTNGLQLYTRETPEVTINVKTTSGSDIESKVVSRKSQAIVAMLSVVVFAIIALGFRYYTGCESILGLILSSVIFTSLGSSWYHVLSRVAEGRLSDLFGIANRLLTPGAISNAPIACIPIKV
jgi:hypothetical protein